MLGVTALLWQLHDAADSVPLKHKRRKLTKFSSRNWEILQCATNTKKSHDYSPKSHIVGVSRAGLTLAVKGPCCPSLNVCRDRITSPQPAWQRKRKRGEKESKRKGDRQDNLTTARLAKEEKTRRRGKQEKGRQSKKRDAGEERVEDAKQDRRGSQACTSEASPSFSTP